MRTITISETTGQVVARARFKGGDLIVDRNGASMVLAGAIDASNPDDVWDHVAQVGALLSERGIENPTNAQVITRNILRAVKRQE